MMQIAHVFLWRKFVECGKMIQKLENYGKLFVRALRKDYFVEGFL